MLADQPYHIPALLPQAIEALNIRPEGTYVDVTYGGGGHSRAILEHLDGDKGGMLYSFDQDREALDRATPNECLTLEHANFRHLARFMRYHDVEGVDGILADLGVSFHHFDDAERGFSFRQDAPLDMRMNQQASLTAAQLLQEVSQEQLTSWLKNYGELSQASRMARAIISARDKGENIATVNGLLDVLRPLINPKKEKKELACVFQALRIVVNDELGALKQMLEAALRVLVPGGRLVIITYHSLEDRLVKNFMRSGNFEGKQLTDVYGRIISPIQPVKGYPITPDEQEIEQNPRCRSARLRVGEKIEI